MKLPRDKKIIRLPHATVQYTNEKSAVTNKNMPILQVQAIDQYGFQREWSLRRKLEGELIFWESHIYQHPGRREICEIKEVRAKSVIAEFMSMCENYPDLLFNAESVRGDGTIRARHEGFVRFAEMLHRGMEPNKRML